MSEFQIGEVAILQNLEHYPHLCGCEVTVMSELRYLRGRSTITGEWMGAYAYEIAGVRELYAVQPQYLRKKRPPEEPSSWDRCVWQPQGVPA